MQMMRGISSECANSAKAVTAYVRRSKINISQPAEMLAVFVRRNEMKTYYPENLRASVKLWFWNVRDFIIICAGIVLSVIVLVKVSVTLPLPAPGR